MTQTYSNYHYKYFKTHKEKMKEIRARYREKNKDKIRKSRQEYYKRRKTSVDNSY